MNFTQAVLYEPGREQMNLPIQNNNRRIRYYPGTRIPIEDPGPFQRAKNNMPQVLHDNRSRDSRRNVLRREQVIFYPGTEIPMPLDEIGDYNNDIEVDQNNEIGLPQPQQYDMDMNNTLHRDDTLPIPKREMPLLENLNFQDIDNDKNIPIISMSDYQEKQEDDLNTDHEMGEFDMTKQILRSEDGIRTYRPGGHLGSYPIIKAGENMFGEKMDFSDALKNNPFHQNSEESLVPRYYYISIDSRDRDRTMYPNPSQYRVVMKPADGFTGAYISRDFHDVVSVELLSAVYPNQNSVLNNLYLILVIPELDDNYDATNTTTTKGFAKLYPKDTFGNHVHAKIDGVEYVRKEWRMSNLKNISRMTIELRLPNGNLFNFGTDTIPPNAPDEDLQNSFTFKITVLEPDTSRLGRQNT